MKNIKRWSRVKFIFSLVILTMILVRLVWMQLRTFPLKSDYRSLVTLSFVSDHFPDECKMSNQEGQDFGVQEFVLKKENYLRSQFSWFYSPGLAWIARWSCSGGNFDPNNFIRTNQWFLVASIAIIALIVRFLTGSWMIGMIAALVLMSRGRIITESADISGVVLLTFLFTVWLLACVHFFRTGAKSSMVVGAGVLLLAALIDVSMLFLTFAIPAILLAGYSMRKLLTQPVLKRLRLEKKRLQNRYAASWRSFVVFDFMQRFFGTKTPIRYPSSPDGKVQVPQKQVNVFDTLDVPFIIWVSKAKRWLKILLFWLVVAAIGFSLLGFWQVHILSDILGTSVWQAGQWFASHLWPFSGDNQLWWQYWLASIFELMDVHLSLSFAIILICCLGSPIESFIGFFETCWLLLFSFAILLLGVGVMDFMDFKLLEQFEGEVGMWTVFAWARSVLVVKLFEPIILGLAVGGLVNVVSLIRVGMEKAKSRT